MFDVDGSPRGSARRAGRRVSDCAPLSSRPVARLLQLEPLEERALMTLQDNSLFPADNPWNQKITNAPVAANSATLVASIGASSKLHPDFGTMFEGGNIGIPYNVVSGTQPKVNVVIDAYDDESDLLPVPIPSGAVIEGDPLPTNENDGDRHLIVYDKDNQIAYELFNVHRPSEETDGKWHADSEAVWNTAQNSFRTPGDTSADAAGLPILPGLVRPDEVLDQGVINHALRFTVPSTDDSYIFPASHEAGSNNSALPRMGERFRLKASFDISGYSPANRVILQALKDYGMIVADNGSSWYLSGSPSTRWNDDDLHRLTAIAGSNFEVVDLTPRVTSLDQTSGATTGGTSVTIHGLNFSGAAGQLQVIFGSTAASSVTIVSDSVIVATSPAHAAGAVHVQVRSPYGNSATLAADQFTFTTAAASNVVARWLFYNNSHYDGDNAAMGAADDAAIATDKTAYLPGGGTASFNSVSSYTPGINGIMIDLAGPHASTLSASDFIFRVGNNNTPNSWTTAPAPSGIMIRPGAGQGGSDRVEITWADGAIQKKWLETIVKANANTGLPQKAGLPTGQGDVFFWGNAVGDAGVSDTGAFVTNSSDEVAARNHPAPVASNIPTSNLYDFNRDGKVDSTDQLAARNNANAVASALQAIAVANPPQAPEGDTAAVPAAQSASGAPPDDRNLAELAALASWTVFERLGRADAEEDLLDVAADLL